MKEVIFKYFVYENNIGVFWEEVNCIIGMYVCGIYLNIVLFDCFVIEIVKGVEKIVGFIIDFILGGIFDDFKIWLFKLKYLY